MGSEDLFHKRKPRSSEKLRRASPKRSRNVRYLVVCEGTKTEPYYLREMLDDLRIGSQTVRVAPNDGTSPDRIVEHALKLYRNDELEGDAFDQVYCVFDRDQHSTFSNAVQRIRDLASEGRPLLAITSTPCFEVWLLLHFNYFSQPFHGTSTRSASDMAISALKKKPGFASYDKGNKNIYYMLKDKLGSALKNADLLQRDGASSNTTNPATNMGELIRAIQALSPNCIAGDKSGSRVVLSGLFR